jgi:hypothetical protein
LQLEGSFAEGRAHLQGFMYWDYRIFRPFFIRRYLFTKGFLWRFCDGFLTFWSRKFGELFLGPKTTVCPSPPEIFVFVSHGQAHSYS